MGKAVKSVQLKELRQQCLDLGLRDIGGKKVLEARLKWAAVPEDKLRAIARDLELLAARSTTPREELIEVLLSEYHHGTIALPVLEQEDEAEEPESVEAQEKKPPQRRTLKKGGLEVPEVPAPTAVEAPDAEAHQMKENVAEEDVAMEDVAMDAAEEKVTESKAEAKEAEPEAEALAGNASAVTEVGDASVLGVPALETQPPLAELPPAAGDAPTFDFGQSFASSTLAAKTPERCTEVAEAPAQKAPDGEDLFAGEGEDDPLLDSLAALKLSTPLKERNAPGVLAPPKTKARATKDAASKGASLDALRKECTALGVRSDGPRGLLVARKAWAELSSMELRLTTLNLETPLPTERSAMVEQLVLLQQAGKLAPPMSCDENIPVPKAGVIVAASARGAFARWTELQDPRRVYFLGKAKTDRSSCTRCGKPIELGEWRVGQNAKSTCGFVSWYHTSCFATAFGRPDHTYEREAEVCALLQELETAAGRWDLFEAKLLDSKCNRFRAAKALRAGLKKPARATKKKKGLWDSDDEAEVEAVA